MRVLSSAPGEAANCEEERGRGPAAWSSAQRQGPGLDIVSVLYMHQVAEKTDLSLPRVEAWDSFVTHKLCESKLMANCNLAVDNAENYN